MTSKFQPPPEEFEDGDVYGHLAQPPTDGPLADTDGPRTLHSDEEDVEGHTAPTTHHDLPPRDLDIER